MYFPLRSIDVIAKSEVALSSRLPSTCLARPSASKHKCALPVTTLAFLACRSNRPKFDGFVQPNIVTSLPPAGGSGVYGRLIPVYVKELRKMEKYIESPFDAPKMQRRTERIAHEKTLDTMHDSKRFSGQVKTKDHFTKNANIYGLGESPDGTTIIMSTFEEQPPKEPLRDKEGNLMAPWYPSNPGKKVSVLAYAPERLPDACVRFLIMRECIWTTKRLCTCP